MKALLSESPATNTNTARFYSFVGLREGRTREAEGGGEGSGLGGSGEPLGKGCCGWTAVTGECARCPRALKLGSEGRRYVSCLCPPAGKRRAGKSLQGAGHLLGEHVGPFPLVERRQARGLKLLA